MTVYRIARSIYSDDLTGIGAGLYGGRWNPIGINLLYTSGSISLASLEYLVHNFHVLSTRSIALIKIKVKEDDSVVELAKDELPYDWQEKTYIPQSTQTIGLEFFKKQAAYLLKVPSAIVPFEYNYLLNPYHKSHQHTEITEKIDPFIIDERLNL